MGDDLGSWDPLSPDATAALMAGVGIRWWLAGGWALDLHLGRTTRHHEDTDVVVLRADLPHLQRHLAGWDLHAADPPGTLRPWLRGEVLGGAVHDLWCRPTPHDPWTLQVMVVDVEDGQWVYRRDTRVRRAVGSLSGPASTPRLPVLAPEVQLLHKSKAPRPKDEADLRAVLGSLSVAQRDWLQHSLALVSPGHPWLDRLSAP